MLNIDEVVYELPYCHHKQSFLAMPHPSVIISKDPFCNKYPYTCHHEQSKALCGNLNKIASALGLYNDKITLQGKRLLHITKAPCNDRNNDKKGLKMAETSL